MPLFTVTGLRNSLECQQTTQINTQASAIVTKVCSPFILSDRRVKHSELIQGDTLQQISNKALLNITLDIQVIY